MASSVPWTSAFRIRLRVAASPLWICSKRSSSLAPGAVGRGGVTGHPVPTLARLTDGAGGGLVGGDPEFVTGGRRLGETEDLDGRGGRGLFHLVAVVVDEGLDPAPGGTGHDRVAHPQGAALDEEVGHRSASGLEIGFENATAGPAFGAGLELLDLGHQIQLLEQFVDADVLESRDLADDGVATPCLGHEPPLRQLLQDVIEVGVAPVDLVDGHHDGDVGGPGMVDGFDGLGHHAVVGRHHQHHDVGDVGPAGPHGREGLVTRGVDEGEPVATALDLVGADVLGDPTRFARHHVGRTDPVEQEGLAVVDVAHDGDHRRPGPQVSPRRSSSTSSKYLAWSSASCSSPGSTNRICGADLGREELDHVVGEGLGGGHHLSLEEEEADDVTGRAVELGTEFARRAATLDDHLDVGDRGVRRRVGGELGRLELFEVRGGGGGDVAAVAGHGRRDRHGARGVEGRRRGGRRNRRHHRDRRRVGRRSHRHHRSGPGDRRNGPGDRPSTGVLRPREDPRDGGPRGHVGRGAAGWVGRNWIGAGRGAAGSPCPTH